MLATLISFMFFALSFHAQPFNTARMNAIKICSEFQIFGILLACVVLQTHHQGDRIATEAIGLEDYGTAQVVLTLAIMPVTIYVLGAGLLDMRTQGADKPLTQAEEDAAKDAEADQKSRKAKKGKKSKTDPKAKKAKKEQKAKKKGKNDESTGTSEEFENPIAAED